MEMTTYRDMLPYTSQDELDGVKRLVGTQPDGDLLADMLGLDSIPGPKVVSHRPQRADG